MPGLVIAAKYLLPDAVVVKEAMEQTLALTYRDINDELMVDTLPLLNTEWEFKLSKCHCHRRKVVG